MDAKKTIVAIILGGLVYLLASEALGILTQILLPFDWTAIGGMRNPADPMMALMLLYGFVLAIGAVVIYQYINLKGKLVQKGAKFGAMMWLLASIPSAFVIYATMSYPTGFYLNTLVFGFIDWVLVGIIIAWVFETRKTRTAKRKRK